MPLIDIYALFFIFHIKNDCVEFLRNRFSFYINLGIPFLITNYRKCVFLALFRDRSIAVRQVRLPRAREKSSKNALFSVLTRWQPR